MNTINSASYNKNPSFGMFNKPSKEVMNHFSNVIYGLTPEGRKTFVNGISQLAEKAKTCPVSIEHSMSQGYYSVYTPIVAGKPVKTAKKHSLEANQILDVMGIAVKRAEDEADAIKNISEVNKIFGV